MKTATTLGVIILGMLAASFGSAGAAPAGGTVVLAFDRDIDTLDPHDAGIFQTSQSVSFFVFDRLIDYDAKGNLRGQLAEAWSVSPDGKEWTFKLRRGVTFHDGTPFNAQAVKFNIDRLLAQKLRQSSKFDGVTGVRVIDNFTVAVTTSAPLGSFIGQLVHPSGGAMQSPRAVNAGRFPVGTGAFKFVRWLRDDRVELEANPSYWGDRPSISRLVVRAVPEDGARLFMLQSGEAHLISPIPPSEINRLRQAAQFEVAMSPGIGWRYIGFNTTKRPFDDTRVRRALNHAVDKQAIVERIFQGAGNVPASPLPTGMWSYKRIFTYDFNPQRARQLLADAGYPNGFSSTLWTPTTPFGAREVAEAVQAYFAAVGVRVELRVVEFATILAEVRKPMESNQVEMFQLSFGGADPDTLRLLLDSKEFPPRGRNYGFFHNPKVDELFERGQFVVQPQRRIEIYRQVQQLVMEQAPWLFLSDLVRMAGYRKNLSGVEMIGANQGLIDVRRARLSP